MGIRANALTDYQVPDFHNRDAVLSLLTPTLSEVNAVADYWRTVQPDNSLEDLREWSNHFISNSEEGEYLRYKGPGGFWIAFGKQVAEVSGPCRWSGFCTMPDLQRPHAAAFRSICQSIGGTQMVLIPDYDPVDDIGLYGGGSLENCVTLLEQRWGAPHPNIEIITKDVEVLYRRKSPAWFLEKLA